MAARVHQPRYPDAGRTRRSGVSTGICSTPSPTPPPTAGVRCFCAAANGGASANDSKSNLGSREREPKSERLSSVIRGLSVSLRRRRRRCGHGAVSGQALQGAFPRWGVSGSRNGCFVATGGCAGTCGHASSASVALPRGQRRHLHRHQRRRALPDLQRQTGSRESIIVPMTERSQSVVANALALSPLERAEVIDQLYRSLRSEREREVESAGAQESERRIDV